MDSSSPLRLPRRVDADLRKYGLRRGSGDTSPVELRPHRTGCVGNRPLPPCFRDGGVAVARRGEKPMKMSPPAARSRLAHGELWLADGERPWSSSPRPSTGGQQAPPRRRKYARASPAALEPQTGTFLLIMLPPCRKTNSARPGSAVRCASCRASRSNSLAGLRAGIRHLEQGHRWPSSPRSGPQRELPPCRRYAPVCAFSTCRSQDNDILVRPTRRSTNSGNRAAAHYCAAARRAGQRAAMISSAIGLAASCAGSTSDRGKKSPRSTPRLNARISIPSNSA